MKKNSITSSEEEIQEETKDLKYTHIITVTGNNHSACEWDEEGFEQYSVSSYLKRYKQLFIESNNEILWKKELEDALRKERYIAYIEVEDRTNLVSESRFFGNTFGTKRVEVWKVQIINHIVLDNSK